MKRESFHVVHDAMQKLFDEFQSLLSYHISRANFSGQQLITIVNKKQSILDYLNDDTTDLIQEKKNTLVKELEMIVGFSCLELFSISSMGELLIDDRNLKRLETKRLVS